MLIKPKNWAVFQHYKDRSPPWIKLHRDILNDRKYMCLPLASKALAPMLWLLASECKDGIFDASVEELHFRLRMEEKEIKIGLKALIDNGFFIIVSDMLAECYQDAIPETETETEERQSKRQSQSQKRGSRLQDNWWPSIELENWAKAERPDLNIQKVAEGFVDYWVSQTGSNASKADWDRTFKNWIRNQKQSRQQVSENLHLTKHGQKAMAVAEEWLRSKEDGQAKIC